MPWTTCRKRRSCTLAPIKQALPRFNIGYASTVSGCPSNTASMSTRACFTTIERLHCFAPMVRSNIQPCAESPSGTPSLGNTTFGNILSPNSIDPPRRFSFHPRRFRSCATRRSYQHWQSYYLSTRCQLS